MAARTILLPLLFWGTSAAPQADLVDTKTLPGFEDYVGPNFYSGYLNVTGPVPTSGRAKYDSLRIQYMFHESQGNASSDPLVIWHQGGPGGNSVYGLFGENGAFQVEQAGTRVNPYSWNKAANMLYLDSPAGSNDPIGFSTCLNNGQRASTCEWDDVTQAEAFAHTMAAFHEAFPEFSKNDFYLSGESYAGQYLPNIANFILNDPTYSQTLNLKGMLVGNGCWGGSENNVVCNGPNAEQNDLDMYYGKGLVSKEAYDEAYSKCNFPGINGIGCFQALNRAINLVGPHNIYNLYDNCPETAAQLAESGKTMFSLKHELRARLNDDVDHVWKPSKSVWPSKSKSSGLASKETLITKGLEGGYTWGCNQVDACGGYLARADVQKALHLEQPFEGQFRYARSGPASVTLYPSLVKKLRVLIFNGDADACVPYKGNEEWTTALAQQRVIKENKSWHPWFVSGDTSNGGLPAGYSTTYSVPGTSFDFSFVTVRLGGHMVPAYQPEAALSLFTKFIQGRAI